MSKKARTLRAKVHAARTSLTVWFSALVPVALAAAETLKEQLPALSDHLSGWKMVAASVVVSAIVTYLRVRSVQATEPGAEQ